MGVTGLVGLRVWERGVEVSRLPPRGSPHWVPELGKAPFLTCRVTSGKERMGGGSENLKTLRDILQGKEEASHLPMLYCARCLACVGRQDWRCPSGSAFCFPLPFSFAHRSGADLCGVRHDSQHGQRIGRKAPSTDQRSEPRAGHMGRGRGSLWILEPRGLPPALPQAHGLPCAS